MIFDLDKWQEIMNVLGRNKMRTFLTAFGVFWGIFMLLVLNGAGTGLENGTRADFGSYATNSLYIWTQTTTKPFKGFREGRNYNFRSSDINALKLNLPEAKYVAPRNQLGGHGSRSSVIRGKELGSFQVYGDVPEILEIMPRNISAGRFINELDLKYKRKVAVIGSRVKEILFQPDENPIGQYIDINGIYFKVVGVYELLSASSNSERELEKIHLPITSFQNAFNYGDIVGWFSLMAADHVSVAQMEVEAKKILAGRHSIDPTDDRAMGSFNAEEEFQSIQNLFVGVRFLIWVVGLGTLLAGVIGVSNIMLVVVRERTKEIGVRKALGATPLEVVSQVILEAMTLTAIAGYFGLIAGIGLIEFTSYLLESLGANDGMFRDPEIDFGMAIQAMIVLIIAGALAGLIPSQRAARINPIVALRS